MQNSGDTPEIQPGRRAGAPRIGPNSRPAALIKLDQRTKEARLIRETRAELLAHVGGNPTVTQRALIEALVQIKLRLALLDRQFSQTGVQTEHDSRTYLAHANTYGRMLGRLGLEGSATAPKNAPALADYLAGR